MSYRCKYDGTKLRELRAERGVGGPLARYEAYWTSLNVANLVAASLSAGLTFANAVKIHGSQRKAAAALGLNLSTFQRRLKKEQACA